MACLIFLSVLRSVILHCVKHHVMTCFGKSNDTLVWRSAFSIIYLHLNAIKCLHSCTYELINDSLISFPSHFILFLYCFISFGVFGGRINLLSPPKPYPVYWYVHLDLVEVPGILGILYIYIQFTNAGENADREMSILVSYLWLLSKAITAHSIVLSYHSDLVLPPVCGLLFWTIFFPQRI